MVIDENVNLSYSKNYQQNEKIIYIIRFSHGAYRKRDGMGASDNGNALVRTV